MEKTSKVQNIQFIGIIPARYASSRFPGKPLANIGGKTMIQRVYEQASKAFEWVYVATDDERIAENVNSFRGKVVLTSDKHKSGTDRCFELSRKYRQWKKASGLKL
jgi:3-deoxy-manno-octulosonate cytidylyltransferase (CMP-KDO synthetase)